MSFNTRYAFLSPDEVANTGDMTDAFHGAKAAVFIGSDLLVYQRDRGVPWPGYWDFPGGGREGDETPFECLRREVWEEFGLTVAETDVSWQREVKAMNDRSKRAWFCVITRPAASAADIRFGDEGQRWALMPLKVVMNMPNLVPALHDRLSLWLRTKGSDPI